ncbi:MAG: glycoside hydrolase family 3 C-terminal domain-containing protein [Ilumatobacter sp.]
MNDLRAVLAELPIERQIQLLSGSGFWSSEAIPELGLAAITLTDGPHGIRRQPADADHLGIGDSVPATCFPTASNLAASWDRRLLTEVGVALGREARAGGVSVLLGPGMNIKRHPGGGRNFEYFSEDPHLSGHLAAAMIDGIQSTGVAACPKHFVANNHESYRMVCDVIVDERTLRELYLRGFEIAVNESAPRTIMTSYNLVNGRYVSDDPRLLTDVLRNEWGFDGLVVSDWGGVNDRAAGVHAGLDLEMPSSGGANDGVVAAAIERGDLDPSHVTDRATAVAALLSTSPTAPPVAVDEVEHHRIARRAAAAGTVLLTNNGVLPLSAALDVAIIGSLAEVPRYQGAGSSQVVPTRLDNARRQLEEHLTGRVRFAAGYDDIRSAAELAGDADVAVVFVGLPALDEAEGCDRSSLALPPEHDALVTAVCAANPRTVVVLANGAPVFMPWADQPAAILEGYLGGQAGASAVAAVLLGELEPGGRLAETFPASVVFPAQEHFDDQRRQVQYREGLYVGYRFHDTAGVAPRFAFGHGLSYTTFEWSEPRVHGEGCDLNVSITVTNTGNRFGSDVVQLYVRDQESTVYRPDKELKAFDKVHLAPGESIEVVLQLNDRAFAFYDVEQSRWRVETGRFDLIVASSAIDVRHTVSIDIVGETLDHAPRGALGPGRRRFVATATEFEAMLGHGIPKPVPVLPFTLNTVIEELGATRLGSVAQRGFLKISQRQSEKLLGADPDPVLAKLTERMIREAPLRFLVSMSGGAGSIKAFEGLTKLLSTLRLTGRRSQ